MERPTESPIVKIPVRDEELQEDPSNLSLPPHSSTRRAFGAFRHLQREVAKVKQSQICQKIKERQIISLFSIRLDEELLGFEATICGLVDYNESLDDVRWHIIEPALEKRCGIRYGRYRHSLAQMIRCLEEITVLLGFDLDEIPRTDISDRWEMFISTLCTVNGALGGIVQVKLSRIHTENQKLTQIEGDSKAEHLRIPGALNQLEALRSGLDTASLVLGDENGFTCDCHKSHQLFLQIKESFQFNGSSCDSVQNEQFCSILLYNSLPQDQSLWRWVDLQTHTADVESGHLPSSSQGGIEQPSNSTSKKPRSVLKKHQKPGPSDSPQPPQKKVGFLSGITGRARSEKGDTDKKRTTRHTNTNKGTVAPTHIVASPAVGLCAFVGKSPPILTFNNETESKNNCSADLSITLSRDSDTLRLKIDHEASETTNSWKSPVTVHNKLTSISSFALSTEQKLQLAYKVASGLFYLHSTSWLNADWSGCDIYLPLRGDGTVIINPLVAKQPRAATVTKSFGHSGTAVRPTLIPPIVSALGRFLLELSCGSSWKQMKKVFLSGSEPSSTSDTDLAIFSEIFSWVEDPTASLKDKPCSLEGWSYFQAIQKCFTDEFALTHEACDFTNDVEYRVTVYQHILLPLQFALEDFKSREAQLYGPSANRPNAGNKTVPDVEAKKAFMLFDDDDLKGDSITVEMKNEQADDWFKNYEGVDDIARNISQQRSSVPENRIRVAILDTGVDVTNDLLRTPWRKHQLMYRDFVGPNTDIPTDEHGHGTHVTSILLKVAPNVDIYMARVSADGKTWSSNQVREAILWAIREKNVHIISISFGFPNVDQSLEPIRQAILEAHAADILIFAAAGNTGRGDHVSFPACLDEVISVGSTDGKHKVSDFVPVLGPGNSLCALGEGIKAAWISPNEDSHATTTRRAGTSYSTPVAAGVAAMVMDFVWAARSTHIPENEWYECTTLRRKRGMLAVLSNMVVRSEVDTLIPWQLFNQRDERPLAGSKSGIITTIIGILRNVYGHSDRAR